MNTPLPTAAISPLRQRLIDDMNMRRFSRETQRNDVRDVGRCATFVGRAPDTAMAEFAHSAFPRITVQIRSIIIY